MPKQRLLVAVAAAIALALLALSLSDTEPGAEADADQKATSPEAEVTPGSALSDVSDTGDRRPAVKGAPETTQPSESPAANAQVRQLRVLLLDESLDLPILGEVEDADGRWLATTTSLGEARIDWEEDGPGVLTLRAAGFREGVATPTLENLLQPLIVRLAPITVARVEVVDRENAPIGGARIRIIPRSRLTESFFNMPQAIDDASWSQTLVTDTAGVVSFPLSRRSIAEIDAPGGARAQTWVQPGTTSIAILDREPAHLTIIDQETGDPISGFLATLEETSQPTVRPVLVESDENGQIPVPSKTPGVVLILKDPRYRSATLTPHPSVTSEARGAILRFDNVEPLEEFGLAVKTCSVLLRLVDDASGLPLTGVVTVNRESGLPHPDSGKVRWHATEAIRTSVRLTDGFVDLGCIYLTSSENQRTHLHVPGYRDARIPDPELEKNAEARTVRMERAGPPLAITIRHADGLPAIGKFMVRDHGTGTSSPPSEADATGTIQVHDWSGADSTVAYLRGRPSYTTILEAGTVPASSVTLTSAGAYEALLILPSPKGRGTIVVDGAPESAPPALALDVHGNFHTPSRRDSLMVIENLPVGEYVVGTRRWLEAVYGQTFLEADEMASFRSTVTGGSVTHRDWDPSWAAQEALAGRVIAAPGHLATLSLLPWYATTTGYISPSSERRIVLDANGGYVIPVGAPVPSRLLVCPASDLHWTEIQQAFLPGNNVELRSGSLIVEWEGPTPASNLTVFVKRNEPRFDAPFQVKSSQGYYRKWSGAASVTFDAVPTYVDHIQVGAKGYERANFPVTIRPEIEALVKISIDDFTPKDK